MCTSGTYPTEKVPYEDDQLPRRNMRCLIDVFERRALPLRVQYEQVCDGVQILLCWYVVVDVGGALKLFLLFLQNWCLARGRKGWSGIVGDIHRGLGVGHVVGS